MRQSKAPYLADDIARLYMADRLDVLLHRVIVVALRIEVVAVLLVNVRDVGLIQLLRLCNV